jgi:glutamyl-tRNA synthetase
LPPQELLERVRSYLDRTPHAGFRDDPRLARAVAISQEKIHTLADFWPLTGPLLDAPVEDAKAREHWLDERGRATLAQAREALAGLQTFEEESVAAALEGLVERLAVKPREVYQPLRVALTGTTVSPGIFESIALLGREQTLRRVDGALAAATVAGN